MTLLRCLVFLCLCRYGSAKQGLSLQDFVVTEAIAKPLAPEYLSVAIDMAQIVGGPWWEGSSEFKAGRGGKKANQLDLQQSPLLQQLKRLRPLYLRIGGTEADSVYYAQDNEPLPAGFSSRLTLARLHELFDFVRRADAKLLFTLNANPQLWQKQRALMEAQLERLIKAIKKHNISTINLEFGNENNAFWLAHGLFEQANTKTYSQLYQNVRRKLQGHQIPLAGPANAFWPRLGEVFSWLSVDSSEFLRNNANQVDQLTWHYYPSQSQRCPVRTLAATAKNFSKLSTHERIEKYFSRMYKQRQSLSPSTEIWLGETGSAQCGGEQGISDSFVSSRWWLNQLGLGALYDTQVQIRQSFIGADYGLLDPQTLQPRPDYYVSLLWKQWMGNRVLRVKSPVADIKAYAHCHPQKIGFKSLLLISFAKGKQVISLGEDTLSLPIAASGNSSSEILLHGERVGNLVSFDRLAIPRKLASTELKAGDVLWSLMPEPLCTKPVAAAKSKFKL